MLAREHVHLSMDISGVITMDGFVRKHLRQGRLSGDEGAGQAVAEHGACAHSCGSCDVIRH